MGRSCLRLCRSQPDLVYYYCAIKILHCFNYIFTVRRKSWEHFSLTTQTQKFRQKFFVYLINRLITKKISLSVTTWRSSSILLRSSPVNSWLNISPSGIGFPFTTIFGAFISLSSHFESRFLETVISTNTKHLSTVTTI